MASDSVSVLFVCLGNICRSTMAEGIFRSLTSKPPYQTKISHVDSCGTGAYHQGADPDSRTMATLKANGIKDYVHSARKVKTSDFENFDYIFAMDTDNLSDLKRLQQRAGGKAKVMLFGEFSGSKRKEEIDDPYYGGPGGFTAAYQQAVRFSQNFLKETFPDIEA